MPRKSIAASAPASTATAERLVSASPVDLVVEVVANSRCGRLKLRIGKFPSQCFLNIGANRPSRVPKLAVDIVCRDELDGLVEAFEAAFGRLSAALPVTAS